MSATFWNTEIRIELARTGRVGVSPRLVEAWIRLERGTLSGLTRDAFNAEVRVAADCVETLPPAESEALAVSYGL